MQGTLRRTTKYVLKNGYTIIYQDTFPKVLNKNLSKAQQGHYWESI